MNLHDYLPQYFPEKEIVMINLEACYKQHSPHSHERALEVIFAEGVKYITEVNLLNDDESQKLADEIKGLTAQLEEMESQHKAELSSLQLRYDELSGKYETLLLKVNPPAPAEVEPETQLELVAQTMGMGNVFKQVL